MSRGAEHSHRCDFLIVGGGVIGTSIAFHLAQRRAGRVMLLEQSYLASGASGKSAAILHQSHRHPLIALLARRCLPVYEHFTDLIGGPQVFWRTGMVQLLPRAEEDEWTLRLERQRNLGIDVHQIAEHELTEVDANARMAESEVAIFEREAGYVEAVQVVASFAEAARREGADIREGVEVRAILTEKEKVSGVETNEGIYECDRLVLATGAWAPRLPSALSLELPVRASRTQVASFRRPVAVTRRGVIFVDFIQDLYVRPGPADTIYAGELALPFQDATGDPDTYNEAADADWLPNARQRLIRRYPAMHCCFSRGGYALLMAQTPDGLPILDRLPNLEGAYCVALGHESFLLAPLIGQILTQWLIENSTGEVDLTPFGLGRFAQAEAAVPEQHGDEKGKKK